METAVQLLCQRVNQVIGALCRWALYLTLTVTFLILAANVGLRYAAGTSLASASELPELLFPWMIMAGVVLAAQHGSHIAVVILTQRLAAATRRWVLSGGAVLVATLYLALVAYAWPLLEVSADERSPILNVPGSLSVGCLMLGFTLLAATTLTQLPRLWSGAETTHGADAADDAHAPEGATP